MVTKQSLQDIREEMAGREVAKTNPPTSPTPGVSQATRDFLNGGDNGILGKLLKFNRQCKFVTGNANAEVEIDISVPYRAHCGQAQRGLVNFDHPDGMQRYMGPVFSDYVPPARETLGQTDMQDWPISEMTGEPFDPWREQILLPLENTTTGEFFTLVVSSKSAMNAVKRLLNQYSFRPNPAGMLVMLRPNRYYLKARKVWVDHPDFLMIAEKPTVKQTKTIGHDLNDEVPFR
jgi:hypothetical protein